MQKHEIKNDTKDWRTTGNNHEGKDMKAEMHKTPSKHENVAADITTEARKPQNVIKTR